MSLSSQLTSLELQYVSPKLLSCRDLELAVPGSYDANKPIVRIQKVAPLLNVITSKQRPRKLSIYGSNGAEFMFLLKGHEDLRQDERVMQLFGLVNTLLANDPETFKRHLRCVSQCDFCFCFPRRVLLHIRTCHVKGILNRHDGNRGLLLKCPLVFLVSFRYACLLFLPCSILRYSVIPLSTNSGLIGWVPHCDTLHALIRDYREKKKILLNVEHRLMVRVSQQFCMVPLASLACALPPILWCFY